MTATLSSSEIVVTNPASGKELGRVKQQIVVITRW
jgi:hypothetical protein